MIRTDDPAHDSATQNAMSSVHAETGERCPIRAKLPYTKEGWPAKRAAPALVLDEIDPSFSDHIRRHVAYAALADPFHVSANTDPKGDRSTRGRARKTGPQRSQAQPTAPGHRHDTRASGRLQDMTSMTRTRKSGASLQEICKIVLYVTNIHYREPVYRLLGRWLQGVYPGLEVEALARPECLVEIDVTAVRAHPDGASATYH